jgi:ABC-type multidrug transport system ATPase subunit
MFHSDISDVPLSQLQTWQLRVLSVAVDVVGACGIIFYELPTQDLDAPSALAMMTSLQRVARGDRIVIITGKWLQVGLTHS